MDKQKAIETEVKRHENILKRIGFANKIAKQVEPLLPTGWKSEYDHFFDELVFSSGQVDNEGNKKPSEEFKLVCKILGKMANSEADREASVDKETNEITKLEATFYFRIPNIERSFSVLVKQYYPDHKCEIKWETKAYQTPIVSDECLGLGGE